jgi:hypothetical protein
MQKYLIIKLTNEPFDLDSPHRYINWCSDTDSLESILQEQAEVNDIYCEELSLSVFNSHVDANTTPEAGGITYEG